MARKAAAKSAPNDTPDVAVNPASPVVAKAATRKAAVQDTVKDDDDVPALPADKPAAKRAAAKPRARKVLALPVADEIVSQIAFDMADDAADPTVENVVAHAVIPEIAVVQTEVPMPTPAPVTKAVKAPALAVEGAPAPRFELPRDGGDLVSLADFAGRKLVIYFYPRANTPGCTKEAIEFTRLYSEFAAAGTAVLGVSADPIKTQESFRDKYDLTTPLLSDATHAMLEAYGAWGEKMMYGKTFEGVLRTTVLINRDGTVAKIWRNVKVDGHADVVLVEAAQI